MYRYCLLHVTPMQGCVSEAIKKIQIAKNFLPLVQSDFSFRNSNQSVIEI